MWQNGGMEWDNEMRAMEWNGNGSIAKPHQLQFASRTGILIEYLCAKTWHILANQFELCSHSSSAMSNYFQRYSISINSGVGKYISQKPRIIHLIFTPRSHISFALQFGPQNNVLHERLHRSCRTHPAGFGEQQLHPVRH